jgi:hypothetical protein
MRSDKSSAVYRPSTKRDEYGDDDFEKLATADKFRPDKGFQGADGAADRSGSFVIM